MSASDTFAVNQLDQLGNGGTNDGSVTITERARVIVSNNGTTESTFGYDKSFTSPSSSSGTNIDGNQEETKKKKKPANWLDVLQIDPKVYWPKKYRYTAEPRPGSYYMLTVKDRDFYEENGFLTVKNLIPINVINKIQENLKNGIRLTSTITDQPINSAITNETLKALINSPRIVRYAGAFCGYNLMAMTCSPIHDYIYYDLKSNGFQRDLHCLPFRPADRIVSVWIALEPCGIEMTNTSADTLTNTIDYMVIPGSHRTGYLETIYSDDDGNKVRMFYERIPEVERIRDEPSSKGIKKIQLKPGDAIFYHPLLAYKIKVNSLGSSGKLVAISCRYASSDCDYIETSSGSTYQDEIPPYLVNSISDYNLNKDFWRNQGLLIKGKRSNL